MKMNNAVQAVQYERVFPILVAKELIGRSEGKSVSFEYHTSWLHSSDAVNVPLSDQLKLINSWNKQGLIKASGLSENGAGNIEVDGDYIPEEGGRIAQVTVLDGLRKLYCDSDFYKRCVGETEMRLKEQIIELKNLLKDKASKLHRKELELKDDEVPNEMNPFLAALFLEMEGKVSINFLQPPARYAKQAEVILKAVIAKGLYVIRTSKFNYDLETGVVTLVNGKSAEFGVGTKLGKLLCSMDESYRSLYAKDIVEVAATDSKKSPQEAASQLIHDIRKRLDIKEGDMNDIFVPGNGWRLAD